jgi:4-amino-4-deoxy-L-arabinose transferase-like glycosyltransferase
MAFFRLGHDPIHEWDEARNGQIAYEMLQRHDFLRYTYAGQPEQWFSKPPLALWSIAASYRAFGLNAFALRFPSALAAFLTVFFTYALARLYASRPVAILAGFILVASRGLFGFHVGRTGDTDGILVLTQVAFVYHALRFLDRDPRNRNLLLAAIWLGLSFLVKGAASLELPAGVFLYAALRRTLRPTLRRPAFWGAAALVAAVAVGWFTVSTRYGYHFSGREYPGKSNWETMILYDVLTTAFGNIEGHGAHWNLLFLPQSLDLLWSPWCYLFYLVLAAALAERLGARWIAPSSRIRRWISGDAAGSGLSSAFRREGAVASMLLVSLPLALLLTVMRSKLRWYSAPLVPPGAVALAVLAARWRELRPGVRYLVGACLLIGIARVAEPMVHPRPDPVGSMLRQNLPALRASTRIIAVGEPRQHYRLALTWSGRPVEVLPADELRMSRPGPKRVLFGAASDLAAIPGLRITAQADGMAVGREF